MSPFQQITHNGEVVAVVVGDEAIIPKTLAPEDRRTVEAMCLYALEVAAGHHAAPYSDERALEYAQQAESVAAKRGE